MLTRAECDQFLKNRRFNPRTRRPINPEGPTAIKLAAQCELLIGRSQVGVSSVKPPSGLPKPPPPKNPAKPSAQPPVRSPSRPSSRPPASPSRLVTGSSVPAGSSVALRLGSRYRVDHELGRGSYGVVYLGWDRVQNQPVAIKTININQFNRNKNSIPTIAEEIETLEVLSKGPSSRYIAQYYDSYVELRNGIPTQFIVSEYVAGQTLGDLVEILDRTHPLSRWNVSALFHQLLLGLKHIHDHGYAHRDIKPDNVMLSTTHQIKYIDFGFACLANCRNGACENLCQGSPGSPLYTPPYYYSQSRAPPRSLAGAQAHDIWALGLTMWRLINPLNTFPFDAYNTAGEYLDTRVVTRNIDAGPIHRSAYSLDFPDRRLNLFVDSLLISDWVLRPTIDEVIQNFTERVLTQVSEWDL